MTQDKISDFFKKHYEMVTVISTVCAAFVWMNGKFNDMDQRFSQIDKHFSEVEKDIAIIKTVLVMKNILPSELAKEE